MPAKNIFEYSHLVNISWIAVAEILTRLFKIIISIFFIRLLGSEQFGVYSSAIALIAAFGFLLDFGLSITIMKELGQSNETGKLLLPIFFVKLIYMAAVIFIMLVIRPYVVDASVDLIFDHVLLWYILNDFVGTVFLLMRSLGISRREAFARFWCSFYCVCAGIISYGLGLVSLTNLINSQILALISFSLTFTIIYFNRIRRNNGFFDIIVVLSSTKYVLNRAVKFGFTNSVIVLFSALDVLLITKFYSYESIGNYAVALRVLMFAQIPIAILIPAMYRMMYTNEKQATLSTEKYTIIYSYSLFFSLCMAFFIFSRSDLLIAIFAGQNYVEAILVLKILSLGLPGYILFPLFTQNLIMCEKNRILFVSYLFASFITIFAIWAAGSIGLSVLWSSCIVAMIFNLLALFLSLFCVKYRLDHFKLHFVNKKLAIIFIIFSYILINFSDVTPIDLALTIFICLAIGYITITELKKRMISRT